MTNKRGVDGTDMEPMEQLERQMMTMKLMLVLMRDRKAKQGQVRSVGYIREYGEMPDEIGVYSLGQLTDEQIVTLAVELGIKKRPAVGKSDIYMNELGYALVWAQGSVDLVVEAEVKELAALAERLHLAEGAVGKAVASHQRAGNGSTISSSEADSPYNEDRKAWEKLIAYWFCQGTASEVSRFPADYVLSFDDALNMNTWDIYEPERFVELVWEHIQFTLSDDKLTIRICK